MTVSPADLVLPLVRLSSSHRKKVCFRSHEHEGDLNANLAHGTFGLAFPFGDVCSSRSSATKDRALAVSGFLAGGITRVGAAEKAELARLGLRVIDASAQGWGIINHDLFLSNANVRQVIRRAIDGRPIFRA